MNELGVDFGGANARRRFLLEAVKNINCLGKPHRVGNSIGVPTKIFHQLEDARPFALLRFRCGRLAAHLHHTQLVTELIYHPLGKTQQITLGRANPMQWALGSRRKAHVVSIPFVVCSARGEIHPHPCPVRTTQTTALSQCRADSRQIGPVGAKLQSATFSVTLIGFGNDRRRKYGDSV